MIKIGKTQKIDYGWKNTVDKLFKNGNRTVDVGVKDTATYTDRKDKLRVSEVAKFHEFGTVQHKATYFQKLALKDFKSEVTKMVGQAVESGFNVVSSVPNKNHKASLRKYDFKVKLIGEKLVNKIQQYITKFGLVRTGRLRSSYIYIIRKK